MSPTPPEPCPLAVVAKLAWWVVGEPIDRAIGRVSAWLVRGVLP